MFDKNELIKKSTPKALPVRSRSLLVPLTKLGLHLRLALVKCSGLVRTKFKLRLWLAFTKCSTSIRQQCHLLLSFLFPVLSGFP